MISNWNVSARRVGGGALVTNDEGTVCIVPRSGNSQEDAMAIAGYIATLHNTAAMVAMLKKGRSVVDKIQEEANAANPQ